MKNERSQDWQKCFLDSIPSDRNLDVLINYMCVIDDSGGTDIIAISDEQAVGYFLKWLYQARQRLEADRLERDRQESIAERRKSFKAISGGNQGLNHE